MGTPDFTTLNHRKRKYIEARTSGLSKREAKNLAGYAASTSSYSVENSSVKAAIARLMRQAIPAHVLVKRIAEGVNAEETKFFQKEGIVTDERRVIAWSERREYLKLAAEYAQYVPDEEKAPKGGSVQGVIIINGVTRPKRERLAEMEAAKLKIEKEPNPEVTGDSTQSHQPVILLNGVTRRRGSQPDAGSCD